MLCMFWSHVCVVCLMPKCCVPATYIHTLCEIFAFGWKLQGDVQVANASPKSFGTGRDGSKISKVWYMQNTMHILILVRWTFILLISNWKPQYHFHIPIRTHVYHTSYTCMKKNDDGTTTTNNAKRCTTYKYALKMRQQKHTKLLWHECTIVSHISVRHAGAPRDSSFGFENSFQAYIHKAWAATLTISCVCCISLDHNAQNTVIACMER